MQMWELFTGVLNIHMYLRVCSHVYGKSEKCLTHCESWAEWERAA